MSISDSLPMTGYIKMIDIWMIFTMSYPFVVITLHCLEKFTEDRGTRRINVIGTCICNFVTNPFIHISKEKENFLLEKQKCLKITLQGKMLQNIPILYVASCQYNQ